MDVSAEQWTNCQNFHHVLWGLRLHVLHEHFMEITGKELDWKSNLGSGLSSLTSPDPLLLSSAILAKSHHPPEPWFSHL